jgi:hypothetical protein
MGSGDNRTGTAVAADRRAGLGHHLRRWRGRVTDFAETLGLQLVEVRGQPLRESA